MMSLFTKRSSRRRGVYSTRLIGDGMGNWGVKYNNVVVEVEEIERTDAMVHVKTRRISGLTNVHWDPPEWVQASRISWIKE